MKYKNNQIKAHFQENRINYIVREYLGCDNDFIVDNLDFSYQIIDSIFKIIDKYGKDTRNIEYIFESDYEEGRASDDYSKLRLLEDFNGIYVYEIKGSEE